jgi:hypothetical protein
VDHSFDFYLLGYTTKKVTIFDSLDQVSGAPNQTAYVSFSDNYVWDSDEGVLQDTFSVGFDETGFFLDLADYSDLLDN